MDVEFQGKYVLENRDILILKKDGLKIQVGNNTIHLTYRHMKGSKHIKNKEVTSNGLRNA